MKTIKGTCSNCGAELTIDLNNKPTNCPSCGAPLFQEPAAPSGNGSKSVLPDSVKAAMKSGRMTDDAYMNLFMHMPSIDYMNKMSALILTVLKLFEGVVAAFLLFSSGTDWFHFLTAILKEPNRLYSLDRMIAAYIRTFHLSLPGLERFLMEHTQGIVIPAILWAMLYVALLAALVLAVIEAILALYLKFGRRGAAGVATVHWIHFILGICVMLSAAYGLFLYIRMFTTVTYSAESLKSFLITCIMMIATFILPGLLMVCYQKDIALAMQIVRRDILTGRPESFKATHLCGICIILTAVMLLMAAAVFAYAGKLSVSSSPVPGGNPGGLAVAFSAVPVFFAIKYLSVMFCYRNMKQARS